jgi:Ice-binding-like/Bacterial Ig-like domain
MFSSQQSAGGMGWRAGSGRPQRTPDPLPTRGSRFAKARWISALVGGLLGCGLAFAPSAFAGSTPTVDLGQAAGYAIISGASVANANTGTTGDSTVRGDIGAPAQPAGFPPGVLDGSMQIGSADATAYSDFLTAYTEVQSRTGGTALPALAGATLTPGLYTSAAAAGLAASTVVTLDAGGNPGGVFVIQVNGALSLAAGAQVKLAGGAQASNVFWAVNGAFSAGANALFAGTVLASTAGAIGADSLINGRVLAETAVTMNSDQFYSAPPTITLTGGAAADINDSTPTISGTTDVGTSGVVTVTIAGQTLPATPALDGSWSVTPTILANGTYAVQAQTNDGAGNLGSVSQQLTIDTIPPLITLDGAPTVLTNNPVATISGTTDAVPGTLIIVNVEAQTLSAVVDGTPIVESVGAQALVAVVQSNGTWNVAPGTPMGKGVRTVSASVTDPAGNTSTVTEQLTVGTVAPVAPVPTAPATTSPAPPTTTSPTTTAPTSPTPKPQAPEGVSVSSHTLTASDPVEVRFTLAKPGTVELKLVEMVHSKAKAIGTVTIKDEKAGKGSYTLTQRFAGHKLGKGSYKLSVETTDGKDHSKALTRKVTVR